MQTRSGDTEIAYQVLGNGPPVVLLHPFPAHHGVWAPAAAELAARYRIILPDLRGHGQSPPGDGPATMEKHAADLVRVLDDAGAGRAVFAGNSIGGYILFEFWRRHRERVAALILVDTKAQADSDEARRARLQAAEDVQKTGPAGFVEKSVERLVGESTRRNRPDIADAARQMMSTATVAGIVAVQHGMAARPDSVPTLKTINVPTLILVGDEDIVTPQADAELMQRGISGSKLQRITAAGHYAPLEQPEQVARAMRGFVDGVRLS
ncbi:MAG TPA: alpha/beta fold hydrolase [Terriglobales bacterium]|nr:alpha/beta fold hydrolase [Terriglobales bacterium]